MEHAGVQSVVFLLRIDGGYYKKMICKSMKGKLVTEDSEVVEWSLTS
jgi:hypothetical protein